MRPEPASHGTLRGRSADKYLAKERSLDNTVEKANALLSLMRGHAAEIAAHSSESLNPPDQPIVVATPSGHSEKLVAGGSGNTLLPGVQQLEGHTLTPSKSNLRGFSHATTYRADKSGEHAYFKSHRESVLIFGRYYGSDLLQVDVWDGKARVYTG